MHPENHNVASDTLKLVAHVWVSEVSGGTAHASLYAGHQRCLATAYTSQVSMGSARPVVGACFLILQSF